MKKSILLAFALLPILASCNKSENGFVNPFPDDEPPIGFNIQEEGKIVRSLTSQETSLINKTIELASDPTKNLYKNIKEESIVTKSRDYERAFAGVFAKGYDSSNKKIDGERTVYRQDPNDDSIDHLRNVTEATSTTLYDYSYGRKTESEKTKTYHYLSVKEDIKYVEYENIGNPGYTSEQVYDNSFDVPMPLSCQAELHAYDKDNPNWYDPDIQISQGEYIFNPSEATSLPGVNKDGNPVLIKESHKPYDKDPKKIGIYELKDGRQYRAAQNELYVTTLAKTKTNESEDWYIVKRSRHYLEVAITSDVIQPNVPISYLSNPIVIAYTEEIITFSDILSDEHKTQVVLPDILIEEANI